MRCACFIKITVKHFRGKKGQRIMSDTHAPVARVTDTTWLLVFRLLLKE